MLALARWSKQDAPKKHTNLQINNHTNKYSLVQHFKSRGRHTRSHTESDHPTSDERNAAFSSHKPLLVYSPTSTVSPLSARRFKLSPPACVMPEISLTVMFFYRTVCTHTQHRSSLRYFAWGGHVVIIKATKWFSSPFVTLRLFGFVCLWVCVRGCEKTFGGWRSV